MGGAFTARHPLLVGLEAFCFRGHEVPFHSSEAAVWRAPTRSGRVLLDRALPLFFLIFRIVVGGTARR
jgi:hypothetical protein